MTPNATSSTSSQILTAEPAGHLTAVRAFAGCSDTDTTGEPTSDALTDGTTLYAKAADIQEYLGIMQAEQGPNDTWHECRVIECVLPEQRLAVLVLAERIYVTRTSSALPEHHALPIGEFHPVRDEQ